MSVHRYGLLRYLGAKARQASEPLGTLSEYLDKCPTSHFLEVFVARKDPAVTKEYDRARHAAKRAEIKGNQPESKQPRVKPHGNTPFAKFVRVRNPRLAGPAEAGCLLF